jgi:GDPmannose 4,6-dehydratase
MNKKALIFGVSGQDGAYLSQLLLEKSYQVFGASRDAELNEFSNLKYLNIKNDVQYYSASPDDFKSIFDVIQKVAPDEIYNLSGQSSVGLSFEQPKVSFESIALGTLYILEAIRDINSDIKFYNACSGECFGNTDGNAVTENAILKPCSPYAIAKSSAYWQVRLYREAYRLFACSGMLFNHESPLRPERFVTRKIVSAAVRISNGSNERLMLGDLSIERDWGWAPEYVDAMWRMLQLNDADDFVIATGVSSSLESFVSITFEQLGLNWKDHVDVNEKLFRPSEIRSNRGNSSKAKRVLGWNATNSLKEVIVLMLDAEQKRLL